MPWALRPTLDQPSDAYLPDVGVLLSDRSTAPENLKPEIRAWCVHNNLKEGE
jgi:hypothetical protein